MKPSVVFMGSPHFAVPSLAALLGAGYPVSAVYTQPDRPVRRGRDLVPAAPPVKEFAAQQGLSVRQPERLRREAVDDLAALAPDLIVVAAYGLILPARVIDLPPHGCLNVHASLLPRHRGAAPISGALLSGDAVTGISIMRMDTGIDTGPVIARAAEPIRPEDTTGTLTPRLAHLGAKLLVDVLPEWLAGARAAEPQDASQATYWPVMKREDALLDWQRPAKELERAVRAFQPWPVAYTRWAGRDLRILQASVFPGVDLPPGAVADSREIGPRDAPRQPVVGTAHGGLGLTRVQPAGGKPVDGAAFLNGHPGFVGARLD